MVVRSIGIVSAKGGVGKTASTINISAALMQMKKSVIMVDADINASGLGLQLGMFHFPFTLNDVLENKAGMLEAMYIHSSGMRIIPASLCIRKAGISRLPRVLDDPSLEGNLIMVDAPPGMESNSQAVLKACTDVIAITTPDLPSVADVIKSISAARENGCNILGMIVNRYNRHSSEQISAKEIESACGIPVIGVVPEDRTVARGIFRGLPAMFLNPYSPASVAYKKVAARIAGEEYAEKNLALKRLLWKFKR